MFDTIKLKYHQKSKYIKDIKNAPMREQFRGFPVLDSSFDDVPDETCCPTGALKYGSLPVISEVNPDYIKNLKIIIDKAKNNPNERQKLAIGKVSNDLALKAKEHGFDIFGYIHDLDVSGVRHAFKHHGNNTKENLRGQIAVTDEDFKIISDIIYNYDNISFGSEDKHGTQLIHYSKKINDIVIIYAEEIRTRQKTLTIKSMWKQKDKADNSCSFTDFNPQRPEYISSINIINSFKENFNPVVSKCEGTAKKILSIDMGKCTFCGNCKCKAIQFTNKYKSASTSREKLIITENTTAEDYEKTAIQSRKKIIKAFSKSLKLRQVSAAGCNGCEMELNACSNCNFDMGRFGIDFVASPRHADGIVVTGPVSENMAWALEDCYKSVPNPKIVILAGACAISGGVFQNSSKLNREFLEKYPIDLYIPGCPIHPLTFINAVLSYITGK